MAFVPRGENREPVATDSDQFQGRSARVLAGFAGNYDWVEVGTLPMIRSNAMLFSQSQQNVYGQTAAERSVSLAYQGGELDVTFNSFRPKVFADLYPDTIIRRGDSFGYNENIHTAQPVSFAIVPPTALNTAGPDHKDIVWYTGLVPGENIGERIFKTESGTATQETFVVPFRQARLLQDFTPGTRQAILRGGQMHFTGKSKDFLPDGASPWETGFPFGIWNGYPGNVADMTVTASSGKFSVTVEAVPTNYGGLGAGTTYMLQYRPAVELGLGAMFSTAEAITAGTAKEVTPTGGAGKYEVRVFASNGDKSGPHTIRFVDVTS